MVKKPVIFNRSILDLGDFNDDEVNTEPSMTDPSQDESIESLVARMMRGELMSSGVPQFDTCSELDAAAIYDRQSETSKDGFDLSDAPLIQKRAARAIKALKDVIPPKLAETPAKPAVVEPKGAPVDAK